MSNKRQQRAEKLVDSARAILDRAEAEGRRALTEAERTGFDGYWPRPSG